MGRNGANGCAARRCRSGEMGALHHVSLAPADHAAWALLLDSLADDDVVVLLDQAIRESDAVAGIIAGASVAVRWCVPAVECPPGARLPAPLVLIADADWWALVAARERLVEWN